MVRRAGGDATALVRCRSGLLAPAAHAQAPQTGRLLVTLAPARGARARARPPRRSPRRAGARPRRPQRPADRPGHRAPARRARLHALARGCARDPRVARVEAEHRARLRFAPNDPALRTPGDARRHAAGHDGRVVGGAREASRPRGTSPPARAPRSRVIDTGVETGHPELAGRVAGRPSTSTPRRRAGDDRRVGHGTHVASLACARGNNGIGLAGAGLRLRAAGRSSPTSPTRASPSRSSARPTTAPTRST